MTSTPKKRTDTCPATPLDIHRSLLHKAAFQSRLRGNPMHTMKQSRIVIAGTLAVACLRLGAAVPPLRQRRSPAPCKPWGEGGGARNAACSNAESLVRAREINLGHTILNQDGCRSRPSGRPITRQSPGRTGPARSSLRTAPGHRKPNWNAGVSMRNSWNEPRGRTRGLCRRRTTPSMEPIASEDGATSARGAGNGSSRGETG